MSRNCPEFVEQTGSNYIVTTDPTNKPNGVPLHTDEHTFARAFAVFNPSSSQTFYYGVRNAKDLTTCIPLAPGQFHFHSVRDEMEELIHISKRRFIPANWYGNSAAAMSVVVLVYL